MTQELENRQNRDNELMAEVQRRGRVAAGGAQPPAAVAAHRVDSLVATRTLGKPDVFTGENHKWNDWKVIFRTYCAVVNPSVVIGMRQAESADAISVLIDDLAEESLQRASQQLCYILLLLRRQHPLATIVNSGENEGFQAWRKLVEYYEPHARARIAGQWLNLLNFASAGDVEDGLALFGRELIRCEQRSGETLSASMTIGIVLRQMEEGPHAATPLAQCDPACGVTDFRRAQSAIALVPVPMDLSVFAKGGKASSAWNGPWCDQAGSVGARVSYLDLDRCDREDRSSIIFDEWRVSARRVEGLGRLALYFNGDSEQVSRLVAHLHSRALNDPGPAMADGVDSMICAVLDVNMIHGNSDAEEVEFNGVARVGIDSCAAALAAKFRVADVSEPLLRVAETVDSCHRLVFDSEGGRDVSYARRATSGDFVKFCRRSAVYEIDVHVDPYVPEVCPVEVASPGPPGGEAGQPGSPRPTAAERAAHVVLREPCRAWRRECVLGRGLSAGRRAADRREAAVAVVGIDCGYFGASEDGAAMLIGRGAKRLALAGHERFVFRSDGESFLVALRARVAAELEGGHGVETVPEDSAVGDSPGNGLAEHAVREVKANIRTVRAQGDDLHGVGIGADHPVILWMVEYAATSISLGRRCADGRTAWELGHGRACSRDLARFSKTVLFLPGGKRKVGFEGEFFRGFSSGLRCAPTSSTSARSTVRCVLRLPIDQRDDRGLLDDALAGRPWAPVTANAAIDEVLVAIEIRVPGPAVPVGAPVPPVVPAGAPVPPAPDGVGLPPGSSRRAAECWAAGRLHQEAAAPAADVDVALALPGPGGGNLQEAVEALLLSLAYSGREVDVVEVFCPRQLVGAAPLFGLIHGGSFDVRVGRDLSDRRQQQQCRKLVEQCRPCSLLGSPRCAPFSMLKYLGEDAEGQRQAYAIGHGRLRFAMELRALQVVSGRAFLREHPWGADSWGLDVAKNVMALPCAVVGRGGQRAFGRAVPGARGDRLAAPRGLRRHFVNKKVLAPSALDAGPNVGDEEISLKDFTGHWRDALKPEFYDDRAGALLGAEMVRSARRSEMDFMAQRGVWTYASDEDCYRELGRKPLSVRWVDVDKGDSIRPDCRSRLVAQETMAQNATAGHGVGAVFAAAPPLECLRLVCSLVMSSDQAEGRVLGFLDISRARPRCEIKRALYVRPPGEGGMSQGAGKCGFLKMALYGARGAGQNVELATSKTVVGAGCDQSACSPCVHCRRDKQVGFSHHGDDFVLEGSCDDAEAIREVLSAKFIVKGRGVLGPAPTDLKEIARLNGALRWRDWRGQGGGAIECEAGPGRAQALHARLGMASDAGSLSTAGVIQKLTPEVGRELPESEAAEHRSARVRLGCLALDRPELQFTAKECARGMQKPTERYR
ncbi:unnamed protein product, partial [Prorocentrum cordatum]